MVQRCGRSTVTQWFVTVTCRILHFNVTAKRQNFGDPKTWEAGPFFNSSTRGTGPSLDLALLSISGSRMQYTRGAVQKCLGTYRPYQTRPGHLSKTAEAVESFGVYRALAVKIQYQTSKYPVPRQPTAEQRSETSSRLKAGVLWRRADRAPCCTCQSMSLTTLPNLASAGCQASSPAGFPGLNAKH